MIVIVILTGVNIKIEHLEIVVSHSNNTVLFQWQPLTAINITNLAVIGYSLQCGSYDHTWQHTVWNPNSSMTTIRTQQFLNTQQYNCSITAFNPVSFGVQSDKVQLQIYGEQIHTTSNYCIANTSLSGSTSTEETEEKWYDEDPIIYILLSLIGVTMATIILLLTCLCYCTCHHRNRS